MLLEYAPRLLVKHLAGGGRRDGTCTRFHGVVLFVDIVDSTSLTEKFGKSGSDGAERLASVLDEYFGMIIELAAAHGGDTFKIDGDAIFVLWYPEQTNPGAPQPVIRAAAAALAIQREVGNGRAFGGTVLHQRMTLVAGVIGFMTFSETAERSYAVVDGRPIRELGDKELRGLPGQIIVGGEAYALLQPVATMAAAPGGSHALLGLSGEVERQSRLLPSRVAPPLEPDVESLVRPFVPRVISDRTVAGQADWIAEFRKITAIYINLPGLDPSASDVATRAQDAVREIAAVVNPLGVPISNIVANEKGFILQIACGLPPYAQEHRAALAVQAALRIRQALVGIGVRSNIGITSGDAFCGDVGSSSRREYVSTGLVMAYAARLMQLADDEIVCDDATARAAMGHMEFSKADSISVKGRSEPLLIRRIRDLARPRRDLPMHPGALFGRAAELRSLCERLAALAGSAGGIAAVEAEPGAGKTMLLAHVADAAIGYRYLTAAVATSQIEKTTAYFVLRTLLPELVRQDLDPPDLPLALVRERLIALVRDPLLASRLALLEDILPLEFADKGLALVIKGQARLSGIEDLLIHIAAERAKSTPLVVIVDDLQWLDASSAHVLSSLVRHVPRALAIVATRPRDASLSHQVAALVDGATPLLQLQRLPPDAIAAIVKARLGSIEVPDALVDFIQTRSEGLPFFAEQLLFALLDQGVLQIEDGRCRIAGSGLSGMAAPDSLQELIVSRIDRLPPDRQLAIKVASAIGRDFDAETVHQVYPLKDELRTLRDVLDQLSDAGLLSRSNVPGMLIYTFRHAIIQSVTYGLLSYAQRRPLHRSIALHLESKYDGALAPHYAMLADHWERAAEADRAIFFRIGAADIALQRYANDDALDHLDRAEHLVAEFGITLAAPDHARCVRMRADACQELTRFGEANAHYRTLAALERIAVPLTRSQTVAGIVRECVSQALRRAGLVRTLSQGTERVRDGLAAHIYMRFAEHAYFANDTLGLAHSTLAALNHAERANALPEIVNACGGLALGLAALGMLRWGGYYRKRSIDLAIDAESPSAQGFAELLACVQSFHTGDWERMASHGALGARIWKDLGDRYRHQACLVLETYRMLATGHYSDAERALSTFGDHAENIESVQVRAWALAARALVDLALGRPPASAIERLSDATAGGKLNPAESLLCNGIAAAAHLAAEDYANALRAAEAGLANIRQSSPAMAGALLFSVPSIAEVLLALAEHAEAVGRTRDELLALSTIACRCARRFAARNRICRPRTALLRGRLAAERGRLHRQEGYYRKALRDAKKLGLPLEQAMSHMALAQVPGSSAARETHLHEAGQILQRIGVSWHSWSRFLR